MTALITNDAVVLGLLVATLGAVFWAEQHPPFRPFFRYVPALLLCYFVPAVYNTVGIVDGSRSALYDVSARFLMPATLVLLTSTIDLPAVARLGTKAIALFLTGVIGVVVGGPLALLIWSFVSPDTVAAETWRGMAAIAAGWIGGSANQVAMKEVFAIDDELFGTMVALDVLVTNLWMAVLLWMAANHRRLDARQGADTSAITELCERMARWQATHERTPRLADLMFIAALGFGATGLAHAIARPLAALFTESELALQLSLASTSFWLVALATILGIVLSLTRARNLDGVGASRIGSALLYLLIATVGMRMDLLEVLADPALLGVAATWLAVHAGLLLLVARLIRAPAFYVAVASQAAIGGAASAPVVAAAFHPALAPVGVLLAVFGLALGTYGAWLCGQLMRVVASW